MSKELTIKITKPEHEYKEYDVSYLLRLDDKPQAGGVCKLDDFIDTLKLYIKRLKSIERPKNIIKIPVKDRTDEEHQFIIKTFHNGSVRNYLLSMGEFKAHGMGQINGDDKNV